MATLTTQMTFLNPSMTNLVMDAISDGWSYGRQAKNLNYVRWEEKMDRLVAELISGPSSGWNGCCTRA